MKPIMFIAGIIALFAVGSCHKDKPDGLQLGEEDSTFVYDGVTYHYLWYRDLRVMLENLAYLPSVTPFSENVTNSPAYYVIDYEGTSVIAAKATNEYKNYGVLYNWEAAKTACPPGWRLATDEDWKYLERLGLMEEEELDVFGYRGYDHFTLGWKSEWDWCGGWPGDNSFRLNIHPCGYRGYGPPGGLVGPCYVAELWTSTEYGSSEAIYRNLEGFSHRMWRGHRSREDALSVRCVGNE